MGTCGGAITNPNYIVGQDASLPFTSPIIDMQKPVSSLCYQMKWSGQDVLGWFIWEASIFPDPFCWEQFVACEEVKFHTGETTALSNIIALPNVWLATGYVRFRWEPDLGSSGTINTAIRIVPI